MALSTVWLPPRTSLALRLRFSLSRYDTDCIFLSIYFGFFYSVVLVNGFYFCEMVDLHNVTLYWGNI